MWAGEDQRHLPDSKPVPSSPVISAHICSHNSRTQPSLVLAGSEQREGPLKHHKWCSQSLNGCCTEKGLSSPAVVLKVKRSGQGLSKVLCTASQERNLLKMVWIFFLLPEKELYRCLLFLLLMGASRQFSLYQEVLHQLWPKSSSQSIPTPLPHQRKTSTQRMGIKIALEQILFPLYLVVCLEIQ